MSTTAESLRARARSTRRAAVAASWTGLLEGRRQRPKLTLEELACRPHVDISRRGRTRGPLDEALARHGLSRRVTAVVATHLAAAVLVAQSDAISLVSQQFAMTMAQVLDVHAQLCPAPLPIAAVAMAWHPRFDADARHSFFRKEVATRADGEPAPPLTLVTHDNWSMSLSFFTGSTRRRTPTIWAKCI